MSEPSFDFRPLSMTYEANLDGGRRVLLNGQDISTNVVKDGVSVEYSNAPTRQCAIVTLRLVVDDLTVRNLGATFRRAANGEGDYQVSEQTAEAIAEYRRRQSVREGSDV